MYFFSGLGTVFSFRLVARRADSGLQGKRFRPSSAYIAKKTGNCSEGKKVFPNASDVPSSSALGKTGSVQAKLHNPEPFCRGGVRSRSAILLLFARKAE